MLRLLLPFVLGLAGFSAARAQPLADTDAAHLRQHLHCLTTTP